ncbi:hypothetical protein PRIPAC_72802 [Pristionchus pacificus]|uniref:Uncharacterized protein n=1 Tax=Pristionchus pacificus TaxID=54126 RepID=A0A2A6C6J5_PRIPA|nr:hypothetical protein PRIPAC_72802 [Pristionchus pacificus]|eukprot:PDM73737.1 hypothetical protein PRIPAC_41093 [Pristionchus pacificus]
MAATHCCSSTTFSGLYLEIEAATKLSPQLHYEKCRDSINHFMNRTDQINRFPPSPITVPVDALDVVVERRLESVELSHGVVEYLEGVGQRGRDGAGQPHVLELRPNLQQAARSILDPLPTVPLPIRIQSSVHVVVRREERPAVLAQRLPDPQLNVTELAEDLNVRMISTKTEMGGRDDDDDAGARTAFDDE